MALRLCFLLLATMAVTAFAEKSPESCMLRRTLRAGVPLAKARVMEQRLKTFQISESLIRASPPQVLSPLLKASVLHVQALQQCIAQRSKTCKTYTPCHYGGKCQLSAGKRHFECKCTKDYSGHDCSTPHPAPIGEFRALVKKIKMLEKTVKNSRHIKQTGCHTRDVGYAYKQSNARKFRDEDKRELDHLTYNKKRDDTVLRITYSSNIRSYGAAKAVRWYVKVDGHECSVPSKIDVGMYQSDSGNTHIPAVLTGICKATTAGPLRKGKHRISTHVGKLRWHNLGDAMSNWVTEVLLEVQEMCPGF